MSGLTEEQKLRIEENRRKAIQLRAARQNQQTHLQQKHEANAPVSNNVPHNGSSHKYMIPHTGVHQVHSHVANQHTGIPSGVRTVSSGPNVGPVSTIGMGNQQALNGGLKPLIPNNKVSTIPKAHLGPNIAPPQTTARGNIFSATKPLTTPSISGTSFYSSKSSTSQRFNTNTQRRPGSGFAAQDRPQSTVVNQVLNKPSPRTTVGRTQAKCVLVSRTRFEVQAGYDNQLIELFKTMETKQYDPQNKNWSFDLKEYKNLKSSVEVSCKSVQLEPLPHPVLHTFKSHIQGKSPDDQIPPDVDLSHVDSELVETLMPFQREGVNFAIRKRGRVLIADDMGLGKTLQALCIACFYRQEWPVLVVVPSSVRFAWKEQFLRWVPSLDPQEICMVTSAKDHMPSSQVTIISYDLLVRATKIQNRHFSVVIMDESHSLKNNKTARTKAATPMLKRAQRVILLSGTPALSRPSELYTQISTIDHRTFPHFQAFGVRYCAGKQMPWGWDFSGSSHMNELQIVLRENIMIRRLKKDVLSQLPTKRRGMVVLDPSTITSSKVMKASHKNVQKLKGHERHGALLEYFHETAASKAAAVKEYVLDLLDGGHKFLFFAHHQEMLDTVEHAVKKNKYRYIRIDGRTQTEQRNILCEKFQQNDEVKVAILSIMAANAGLNFTSASLVVFGELFWNPGILVQAEDRAHRIGQEDSVSVQYLVATGTADDYIWPLVQKKLDVLGKAGLSKDNFSEADTKQQINKNDIMKYFEESFFEDDDIMAEMESGTTQKEETKGNSRNVLMQKEKVVTKKQGTLLQYLPTTKSENLENEQFQTGASDKDWGDDDDFPEELLLSDDFDEPLQKRTRLQDQC